MSRKAFVLANGVLWNVGCACDPHPLNKQLSGIHLPVLGRVIFAFVSPFTGCLPTRVAFNNESAREKDRPRRCCLLRSLVARGVNLYGFPMRKSNRQVVFSRYSL